MNETLTNETLAIENFAGINRLEIDLKKINVLIGPQATGKSVIAKLLFYFKGFIWELLSALENEQSNEKEQSNQELDVKFIEKFEEYFPPPNWGKGNFCIRYKIRDEFIEINRIGEELKVSLQYSEYYKNKLIYGKTLLREQSRKDIDNSTKTIKWSPILLVRDKMRDHISREIGPTGIYYQFFIPAGRSFFANLEGSGVFTFIVNKIAIDPFLAEFGLIYEQVKEVFDTKKGNAQFDDLAESIICGKYRREKTRDYIIASDGRKVDIAHSSSGQQETLPLILILRSLPFKKEFHGRAGQTVYIEEPEAHMFPTAQRNIIELIATVFNESKNLQFFITTHSPYVLTAINNLLQAGQLQVQLERAGDAERLDALKRIVPPERMLNVEDVAVYSLSAEGCEMIIDQETGLIQTNIIDKVSDELAIQFGKLLDFIE